MERLRENAERAMQAEAVRDREGNPTGEYVYAGAVANRALELLGKEIGMFVDRREQGGPGDFDKLSDEALDRELAARLRSMGVSERTIRGVLKPANDEADAS